MKKRQRKKNRNADTILYLFDRIQGYERPYSKKRQAKLSKRYMLDIVREYATNNK